MRMLFSVLFTLPFFILLSFAYTSLLCMGAQQITVTHVCPVDSINRKTEVYGPITLGGGKRPENKLEPKQGN
jgi:hypothetical protein